jgi:hypothetical protein
MRATHTFEVEVTLSGTYQPGRPEQGPTYDCGGQPAEPACVEDLAIEDIGIIELDYSRRNESHPRGVWKTTSLLDGIDRSNPEIQKLFANILSMQRDAAEAALLTELEEG